MATLTPIIFPLVIFMSVFLTVLPSDAGAESLEQPASAIAEETHASQQESRPISTDVAKKRYALGSLGIAPTTKSSADLDRDLANTVTSSINRTNPAWKIVGGYKFTQRLAVEAGYARFQKMNTTISTFSGSGILNDVVKLAPLTMNGAIVEGVATWEIDPLFSLIGKAGGFVWQGGVSASNQGEKVTRKDHGIDLVLGFGADFHIWEQKLLRIEWERFFTPDQVDLFSVGLGVEF